ncbi:unnamed protein product [Meganyctiphanes norvegica]|uniref:Sphingomyelin phosphodiesterase n=1 Tax=Meganyctiphanes norvegica TaxID=48144 RepID=A0AAV2RFX6_MEGNR
MTHISSHSNFSTDHLFMIQLVLHTLLVSIKTTSATHTVGEPQNNPIVIPIHVKKCIKNAELSTNFQKLNEKLELSDYLRGTSRWEYGSLNSLASDKFNLFCNTCNVGFGEILGELSNGVPLENILNNLKVLCIDLGIGNEVLCNGFIEEAYPQLSFIIEQRPVLTGQELTGKDMCGMLFVGEGCTFEEDGVGRLWSVDLPGDKPEVVKPEIPQDAPVMKILHLADTHFDPYYQPGSNAVCGEKYFCCRNESGPVINPEDAAGKWGDYRSCDAPRWTLEALYTHITETHEDIDLIIWTGDLVPHVVWNTTQEGNLMVIREAVQMVKDFFPDTPVFPAIGNHEGHPVNTFPPPWLEEPSDWDVSWLYDEIMNLWLTWLPEDVASSVAYSAYYSTEIMPGLRVLSVNSNYCYGFNWWLLLDSEDVAEELQWMIVELQKAEDAGDLVYIIQHIPPGKLGKIIGNCIIIYHKLLNCLLYGLYSTIKLFDGENTLKGYIFLTNDVRHPWQILLAGQLLTGYNKLSDCYLYIDGATETTTRVLDHENWIMDLDETNANDSPSFIKTYDAKTAYNLKDLSPASWSALVDEMAQPNSTAFDTFYTNYVKSARPYMEEGCNERCKSNIICRLVVSDNSDHSHCEKFTQSINL